MAYIPTRTYRRGAHAGRRYVMITLTETEGAAASETTFDVGFREWRIGRVKLVKTAGTAATFAPVFGTATNPTAGTAAYIGGLVAAASQDSDNTGLGWTGRGTGTMYWRSVPNLGADNATAIELEVLEGWQR